ncbi:NADase-type glycan-binding domain-containing protein [Georgenia wangjunii]|uniref:NADase-type glycan-binding domain-containing protein n=1 Tax=Georgenia wangjunii TaxID=3117730 RepID=UPI002F26BDED
MQICTDCGTRNEDDEQFCGGCGSYLEWADEQVPVAVADADPGAGPLAADVADDGASSYPAPPEGDTVLAPPTDDVGDGAADDGAPGSGSLAPPSDDVGDAVRGAGAVPAAGSVEDGGNHEDREDRPDRAAKDAGPEEPVDGTAGGGNGGGRGALGVAAAAGAGLGAARALDRATGGRTGVSRATGGLGQVGSTAGRGRGGAARLLRDVAGRAGVDTSAADQARRAGNDVRHGADQVRSSSTRVEDAPAAAATKPAPARPAPTRPAPAKPARPAVPAGTPAGVQPRKPAPVRPGAPAPRRRVVPAAEDEAPPAPGDLICGSCGAGNTPQRRFCRRCGASLADAPVQPQRAWWRRVLRPDPKPGPVAGARPRARKNRRFPTGLVVTLVILGLLGFAGWTYRDQIVGAYDSVLDRVRGDSQVTPVHDVLHSSQAEGRTAVQARDGLSDRSWAPVPLGEAAEGEWIQFTFEEPFRLVHVLITGGNSADEEQRLTEGRPREVRLEMHTAAGGEPVLHEVTLEDTSGPQTFTFDGIDDVTGVRLTILSTYGATPETPVAVAEVEFRGRG